MKNKELSKETKEIIEKEAYEKLQENNCDLNSPTDIVAFARKIGFIVGTADFPDELDGLIIVDKNQILENNNNEMLILANENRDKNDIRFIVAHELGHYFHECKNATLFARRDKHDDKKERSLKEQEIDFYAACLLMPRDAVIEELDIIMEKNKAEGIEPINVVAELAAKFNVTFLCAKRRLSEILC